MNRKESKIFDPQSHPPCSFKEHKRKEKEKKRNEPGQQSKRCVGQGSCLFSLDVVSSIFFTATQIKKKQKKPENFPPAKKEEDKKTKRGNLQNLFTEQTGLRKEREKETAKKHLCSCPRAKVSTLVSHQSNQFERKVSFFSSQKARLILRSPSTLDCIRKRSSNCHCYLNNRTTTTTITNQTIFS